MEEISLELTEAERDALINLAVNKLIGDFLKEHKEYLNGPGAHCLNCGSSNIEGDQFGHFDEQVSQHIFCHDCESEWDDVYKLESVENVQLTGLDPPEDNNPNTIFVKDQS